MGAASLGSMVALLAYCTMTMKLASSEILTPPYFNLAEGRKVIATATCGVNITESKELFCRLTGASADERQEIFSPNLYSGSNQIIAGQLCDYCVAEGTPGALPSQVHSAKYAVDGTERWWQSPPLSRGYQFNEVNLTVDLGQEFHVAYVFIKMGNSPRPGVWSLDRSIDYGKTWQPWQYFADSAVDCKLFFNKSAQARPNSDDGVICTTEFSKIVPLEGGEIAVSLVQDRPGSLNFSHAPILQNFTKATNIRLSLMRTQTLQGHLMLLRRHDPTVTRRYFYSVRDISIGGRCVCNGHADVCDKKDQFKLVCDCQHNTCGDQCERCCEPFVQKKWREATDQSVNACEPCQCFGHSDECVYDEEIDRLRLSLDIHGRYDGGGVCKNCQDNTKGINCERCVEGFFRPAGKLLSDPDVCQPCVCDPSYTTGACEDETGRCFCKEQYTGPDCRECAYGYYDPPECRPCDCFLNGTIGEVCEVGGGQCPCLPNFGGNNCNKCAPGYWKFPQCESCTCDSSGSLSDNCDVNEGHCQCQYNFVGVHCDECNNGYFAFPECSQCDCDVSGTVDSICDKNSGQCLCKPNFAGERCDRCAPGFFSYPDCKPCSCSSVGSEKTTCDEQGQCTCKANFGGRRCESCAPGFHNYPNCLECLCNRFGSVGRSCDQASAQCVCRPNFVGLKCDKCAPDFYNFPRCEACLCNPAGAVPVPGFPLGGCGSFTDGVKLCQCKPKVFGHICDQCMEGFWKLDVKDPNGCQDCNCHTQGTLLGDNMCDMTSGQCFCKSNVNSRRCETCADGTFNLQHSNLFGCEDCDCDVGGAMHDRCDKLTGQCVCRPRVNGRTCSKPIENHYFPTLHQMKYEMEDGFNPIDSDSVRFGFDKTVFPDYSWRGYAVFSRIQPEVRVTVNIEKPSVFKLIFRFVNRNSEPVKVDILVTPDDPSEAEQKARISFPTTPRGDTDLKTSDESFVMNPGEWNVTLKTEQNLDVDYLVLLPQAYYEAAVLQNKVRNPCIVPNDGRECLHYTYVNLDNHTVDGAKASSPSGSKPLLETNRDILVPLGFPNLALLDPTQPVLVFDLNVTKPGLYMFVIGYTSPLPRSQSINVLLKPQGANDTLARAILYECQYSSLCRQEVIDLKGHEQTLNVTHHVKVTITGDNDTMATIGYVAAIPAAQWNKKILQPAITCIQVNGVCVDSSYPIVPESIKVEVKANGAASPKGITPNMKLVKLSKDKLPVEISVTVDKTDDYVLLVSYFQPDSVGFPVNVTVDVNNVMYSGYFDAAHCPNTAGCRGVVHFHDILLDSHRLEILSHKLVAKIQPPLSGDHSLWIDSVQLVPAKYYNPRTLLMLEPYDLSGRFLAECSGDNFYIDTENNTNSPFCNSAMFSITTEYNNGALPCACDPQGSESFKCAEFGGQCQCKPHIIGRRCNACEQNYYGFPDCRPCNCPATCNAVTGACECPKRVTGPNCDQCAPRTFGYDRTIGCMDCHCNVSGVLNDNLDCELDTGSCDCKPNVAGRKCDFCMNGFWNYPSCNECGCDPAGTTEEICNKETSQCLCKERVDGPSCGSCNAGTFNLESRNPQGCTKCFCFGITATCSSSNLLKTKVTAMTGWNIIYSNVTVMLQETGDTVTAQISDGVPDPNTAMYWVAPDAYLGNKLTSYGGVLKFSVINPGISRGDMPKDIKIPGGDVIMVGKGAKLVYQLLSPVLDEVIEIDILESSWQHFDNSAPVTREQLMTALSNITELYIKANYYTNVKEMSISSVELDIADGVGSTLFGTSAAPGAVSRSFTTDLALGVEMCLCPPNYRGTSCEECADGFYRKTNEFGRYVCAPCECNGHSNVCNRETGICIDCQDHTVGDHCENCIMGYTGEPTTGEACVICACPMPIDSNNFAKSCVISPLDNSNTIMCDCMPGYLPPFCSSCGPGFYGNPHSINGSGCRPCECNGNIDPSDAGSCDNFGGGCLKCQNNTQGNSCEECEDMYWGDAIDAKNCTGCDCDSFGTDSCDKATGQCLCKPNVIGLRCDQCAPDTWGFLSGTGCSFCNCSIAANSSQCDQVTGDCHCLPGTTGKLCSSCLPRHWDFSAQGCKACKCELDGAVGCNVITGDCQCLHGVTGDRCDRCEPRWVLIPDQGCEACDNCVHTLLDDTDQLRIDIANASDSLYIINIGVKARQRLELLNQTTQLLKDRLANVPRRSLDPAEMQRLSTELTDLQRKAADALRESDKVATVAKQTSNEYTDLLDKIRIANNTKTSVIGEVKVILDYMRNKYNDVVNSSELVNADKLLRDAQEILANMQDRTGDLSKIGNDTAEANRSANQVLELVKGWGSRSSNLTLRINSLLDVLNSTSSRLLDLLDKAQQALAQSGKTDELLVKVKTLLMQLEKNIKNIKTAKERIESTLELATKLTGEAEQFVNNATEAYEKLQEDLSILEIQVERLDSFYKRLADDNVRVKPVVDNATEHARNLKAQAANLESLLRDTNEASAAAVRAANAYDTIVQSINRALNASQNALRAAMEAIKQSKDIQNNTQQVRNDSLGLLTQAERAKNETKDGLKKKLDNSKAALSGLDQSISNIEQKYADAKFQLHLVKEDHEARATEAKRSASNSTASVRNSEKSIQPILDTLDSDLYKATQVSVLQNHMEVDLVKVRTQLETIRNNLPTVSNETAKLSAKVPILKASTHRLNTSITELKEKIRQARDLANRMKVPLKLYDNTYVELRAPEEMLDSFTQTSQLSLYFQTKQKDGLLMYVGPKFSQLQVPEYLSLELDKGHVVWRYNLGATPAEIRSKENTYDDDKWHKVVASRSGKNGVLVVETEREPDGRVLDKSEGSSGGQYAQLDLVPQSTKVFAGGVPANFSLPEGVQSKHFAGGLDELTYSENQLRLGLWNFVNGQNNKEGTIGRGKELQDEVTDAVRFIAEAQSYITIDKGNLKTSARFSISLKFRTLNEDGLMFFMGQDGGADYFKVYLQDGKVYAKIDLGGGAFVAMQPMFVADGKEHMLSVVQASNKMVLRLTPAGQAPAEEVSSEGNPRSKDLNLGANPELHIGGIPQTSKFSGTPAADHPFFDGCISEFYINEAKRNIIVNYKAKVGVVPGCMIIKRSVSFKEKQPDQAADVKPGGYVHIVDADTVNENFTLGMRIKSTAENGLLFYAADEDEEHAFSVSLREGQIEVKNTAGSTEPGIARRNEVITRNKFNDGLWHHISVTKTGLDLTIFVDDNQEVTATATHRSKKTRTSREFGYYLGGIPAPVFETISDKDNSASWENFVGCLSDVSIRDKAVDFAVDRPSGDNVDYSACPVPDPVTTEPTTEALTFGPQINTVPGQCSLPVQPNSGSAKEQGTRFGLAEDSRLEYDTFAGFQKDVLKQITSFNNIRFRVKTTASDGMIWFVGNKNEKDDFEAVFICNGSICYSANLGGGVGSTKSPKAVHDGAWHSVEIRRYRKDNLPYATLVVDGEDRTFQFPGVPINLDIKALPIYVGGMDTEDIRYRVAGSRIGASAASSLSGCIDSLEYKGKEGTDAWLPYGTPTRTVKVQACFQDEEDGMFIPSTGGYLSVVDTLQIGTSITVEMSVRPRTNYGTLMGVWGGGDYLILELFEGAVYASVNNGAGNIEASVRVPAICDGQWRTIRVKKMKNLVTLTVLLISDTSESSGLESFASGSPTSTSAETTSPLYVGGLPDDASLSYTVRSRETFVGCIRNVKIDSTTYSLNKIKKFKDATAPCPTI